MASTTVTQAADRPVWGRSCFPYEALRGQRTLCPHCGRQQGGLIEQVRPGAAAIDVLFGCFGCLIQSAPVSVPPAAYDDDDARQRYIDIAIAYFRAGVVSVRWVVNDAGELEGTPTAEATGQRAHLPDALLTKLRILHQRALREAAAADEAARTASRKAVEADLAYQQRGRDLGLCVLCGEALPQCTCPAPRASTSAAHNCLKGGAQ